MLDLVDAKGLFGLLIIVAGVALLGYVNPAIAAGVVLVVLGVGLVAFSFVSNLLGQFGMEVF